MNTSDLKAFCRFELAHEPDQMKIGMMVTAILQTDMRSKNNPFAMWIVGAAYTCNEVRTRLHLSFTRSVSRAVSISISMKRKVKVGIMAGKVVVDMPSAHDSMSFG